MSTIIDAQPDRRWRLLVPEDAVIVDLAEAADPAAILRAQSPGTPVAMIGGPRRHRFPRRYGVTVERICVAIPSLNEPVVVAEAADGALAWLTGQVLTVPSGRSRGHGLTWVAVLIVRRWPRLLMHLPIGDRIVIGVRR